MYFVNNKVLQAVIWFILSLFSGATSDVIMKFMSGAIPAAETTFFRYFFATISLLPFMFFQFKNFKSARMRLHFMRGLILGLAIFCWVKGFEKTPLTVATLITFVVPMFVIFLAPIFLQEKVSAVLVILSLIGFAGVYIAINPTGAKFHPYTLLMLLSIAFFASLDIINKKFISKESMMSMVFYSAFFTMALSFPFALNSWVTPSLYELTLLAILGVLGNAILFFILKAFALVNASSLAPYRYLELLISAVLAYIIFNELPTASTLMGATIIIPVSYVILRLQLQQEEASK